MVPSPCRDPHNDPRDRADYCQDAVNCGPNRLPYVRSVDRAAYSQHVPLTRANATAAVRPRPGKFSPVATVVATAPDPLPAAQGVTGFRRRYEFLSPLVRAPSGLNYAGAGRREESESPGQFRSWHSPAANP